MKKAFRGWGLVALVEGMSFWAKILLAVWVVSQAGVARAQPAEGNATVEVAPHLQTDAERQEQRWILMGVMAGLAGGAAVYLGKKARVKDKDRG